MKTENLERFLQAYPDGGLVILLEECQNGNLSYMSCGCFVGLRTANHPPAQAGEYCANHLEHLTAAREMPYAIEAEEEFRCLGDSGDGITPWSDALRRERIIPLILAEMTRRTHSPDIQDAGTEQRMEAGMKGD